MAGASRGTDASPHAASAGCASRALIDLTRRRLLVGVALVSWVAPLVPRLHASTRGQPFSDGSLFADDGTGWVE